VKVSQGTLSSVSVTTKQGKTLNGSLAPDQLSWTSAAPLTASTEYQVSVEAASADGTKTTSSSSFSTLTIERSSETFHGSIERVTTSVFLLSPAHVEIGVESEPVPVQERSFFNQS
jgi:hypothetical protein